MRKIGTTWEILSLFYAPKKERILTTIKKIQTEMHWIFDDIHCDAIATSHMKSKKKKKAKPTWALIRQKVSNEILILEFNLRFRFKNEWKYTVSRARKLNTARNNFRGKIDCRLQRMKR